jgi:hypothetical protein
MGLGQRVEELSVVRGQLVDDADEMLDVRPQLGEFGGVLGAELLQALSLSYLPSVGPSWSFVRSAAPGVLGMAVSLSPLDGLKNLAARGPATTRPLIGIRDSIAV